MRILMVQDTFLPKLGGAEVHVWKLSKTLRKRGHEVTIATSTEGELVVDGLMTHRFPYLQSQGKKAILALPFYLPALARLVAQHEIVHSHYTALCSAVFGSLSKLFRRPFIVTLHGYGTLDSSARANLWMRLWRHLAFRAADKVIATSSEMVAVAQGFVPEDRIVFIPNGVDTQEFAPADSLPSSPIRIATVRRLVPKNGVQYLIEAAPLIIRQSHKPVEFWIIGEGSLRQYLEELVTLLGVEQDVRFFGAVPNDQIPYILQKVHIMAFPSSAESTSIAALEAMSMAKAIVASAVGAYPEMLGSNERGLLVKLFDREHSDYDAPLSLSEDRLQNLAAAVVQLIEQPALSKMLGERARLYVRQCCDWEVIAQRIEFAYAQVSRKA
jgi:glycosyltransferase involved in cell wall biosynthesis